MAIYKVKYYDREMMSKRETIVNADIFVVEINVLKFFNKRWFHKDELVEVFRDEWKHVVKTSEENEFVENI